MNITDSDPTMSRIRKRLSQDQTPPDPATVVADLLWLSEECRVRCMVECSKWSNELLFHLPQSHYDAYEESGVDRTGQTGCSSSTTVPLRHHLGLEFVRSLIADKEYRRAKFHLGKVQRSTPTEHFLYYFSWYMISVQTRLENDAAEMERKVEFADSNLAELRQDLEKFKQSSPDSFDCFMNYLLGMVRKDSDWMDGARDAFREAVELDSRCWPAWEGLSKLVDVFYVMRMEKRKEFAKSWHCSLFIAEAMFHLQLYLSAIDAYSLVATNALGSSPYIICHIATAQSELQEHDSAMSSFQRVRKLDPYRLEQMNFYSDSLYIRNTYELASLAKWFHESHKFHWETCCIVANYYSARNSHELAQDFLKRAAKLNPTNASIWVLLGHEYMETKNHQLAITAYRKATVIEPAGCYRGWYGLGQLYEIMKEPENALHYYQQAHKCRPADSRMLIALGVIFSKLGRRSDAEKCFKKAFQVGDVEGNALTSLARLYDEQGDAVNAAKAYEAYLTLYSEELIGDLDLVATAAQYLAKYNLDCANLDAAYNYAQRCLTFETSKEEGFRILRLITNRRHKENAREEEGGGSSASAAKEGTPANRKVQQAHLITPVDVLRPLGGGDESTISETPAPVKPTPTSKQRRDEERSPEEPDEDDMNLSGDDDDMEFSF